MRQHTSDCRQRRAAVEQLVSHENLNRKEGERMGKEDEGIHLPYTVMFFLVIFILFR